MSAASTSKDGHDVQDRIRTAMPGRLRPAPPGPDRSGSGAILVLVVAVVGSCVPLAGEHVPAKEAPGLAKRAQSEGGDARMETKVYRLCHIQAEGSLYSPSVPGREASTSPPPVEVRGLRGQMSLLQLLGSVMSRRGAVRTVPGTNSVVVTDTPEKLKAMEEIISRLDRLPKQVHFSVKLAVLSDKDAEKVRASILKDARLAKSRSADLISRKTPEECELGSLDFAKLRAFLDVIRTQTEGRIMQAPQVIALAHEQVTVRVDEVFRYHESLYGLPGSRARRPSGSKPKGPPFSRDIQILVIPHVTGPDNNVILTVIPKANFLQTTRHLGMFDTAASRAELMPPQMFRRVAVTKIMVRDRDTAILSGLRARWRGETVNMSVLITPTVIDFEKRPEIGDSMKRSQEE